LFASIPGQMARIQNLLRKSKLFAGINKDVRQRANLRELCGILGDEVDQAAW
jgi:hypothetical protein